MGREILILGLVILVAIASVGALTRLKLPPLIAFLMLGFGMRLTADRTGILDPGGLRAFEGLGAVGITVLLFRVGLKSNVSALLGQLRRASPLWLGNILASASLGYAAAFWLLDFDVLTSVVVAIALTATSVGVPAEVWNRTGKINTPAGELFIDVAELDDISGVVAVAVLVSVMADLPEDGGWSLHLIARTAAVVIGKLAAFIVVVYAYAHWVERRVTRLFGEFGRLPHPMLLVAAVGLIFAGTAELLGLSVAVGGFFAGLAHSRDPAAVQNESDFEVIYELFVPFFFIHVGMQVTPEALGGAVIPGLVLLGAGVLGKILGNVVPGSMVASRSTATLLAVSMIPRAEIALLVTQRAEAMGYASREALSAVIFVSATSCLVVPGVLERLLQRTLPSEFHGRREHHGVRLGETDGRL